MSAKRKNPTTPPEAPSAEAESKKRLPRLRPDEMSPEVIEFITAIDEYKRVNGRPFPNWSEILEVLTGLGYRRSD